MASFGIYEICYCFQMENSNQSSSAPTAQQFEVASCKSHTQLEREKATFTLNMSPARIAAQDIPTPGGPDADDSGKTNVLCTARNCVKLRCSMCEQTKSR